MIVGKWFKSMNTSSQGVKDKEKEEQIFRNHKYAITFTLLNLGAATAGKIKTFIDNKIDELKPYIEERENTKYEKGGFSKEKRDKNIEKQIARLRMSRRAIHFWLKRLQAEKLIEKNANSEYSLTFTIKRDEMIFELMAQEAFEAVTDLPFSPDANLEEQFEEVVKRLGAYVMYIFLKYSHPTKKLKLKPPNSIFEFEINDTRIKEYKQMMIKHHINPLFMYHRIFYERFVGDRYREGTGDNYLYEMNQERLNELLYMFSRKYPDIYKAINADASDASYHKTLVPYHNQKIEQIKKQFPILEKEFEKLLI